MAEFARPRVVGFNHVALEVGDIDEALAFYGRLFRFELRGKSDSMAFIDLGDQFIALQKAVGSPQTMVAISVSLSTTRRRPAKHSRPLVSPYWMVRSLIFGTPWQPSRDRRLRQYPVHQGAQCAAWHGPDAPGQER